MVCVCLRHGRLSLTSDILNLGKWETPRQWRETVKHNLDSTEGKELYRHNDVFVFPSGMPGTWLRRAWLSFMWSSNRMPAESLPVFFLWEPTWHHADHHEKTWSSSLCHWFQTLTGIHWMSLFRLDSAPPWNTISLLPNVFYFSFKIAISLESSDKIHFPTLSWGFNK